jgi:hypothetical protein
MDGKSILYLFIFYMYFIHNYITYRSIFAVLLLLLFINNIIFILFFLSFLLIATSYVITQKNYCFIPIVQERIDQLIDTSSSVS